MLNFACPVKSVFIFNRGSSSRKTIRLRRINHRNTSSILRIALKLHFVQNLSLTQKLGKRGRFAKVSFYNQYPSSEVIKEAKQ